MNYAYREYFDDEEEYYSSIDCCRFYGGSPYEMATTKKGYEEMMATFLKNELKDTYFSYLPLELIRNIFVCRDIFCDLSQPDC